MASRNATEPLDLPIGNVAGLTELDLVGNMMLGQDPVPEIPAIDPTLSERDAMEEPFVDGLSQGPCLIPFTGGRDSSAGLAVATAAARKRGLPDPIPITAVYPDARDPEEARFSEVVVKHLGLSDWVRFDVRDEFQIVGPVAQRTLRRHGIMFPAASYMMDPMLERAAGATLMLTQGASDFFYFWRFGMVADVVIGKRRPQRSDLPAIAFALMPPQLRARQIRAKLPDAPSWLRPDAAQRLQAATVARMASAPLRFDKAILRASAQRCHRGAALSLQAMADHHGARLVLPVYDRRCAAIAIKRGGWRGWGGQAETQLHYVRDMLPPEVLTKRRPARIGTVLFGEHNRAFAERWSGEGLDPDLVDVEALRTMWLGDPKSQDWRSSALMQLAWLHDELAGEPSDHGVPEAAPALIS